jgi:hypothetical protein
VEEGQKERRRSDTGEKETAAVKRIGLAAATKGYSRSACAVLRLCCSNGLPFCSFLALAFASARSVFVAVLLTWRKARTMFTSKSGLQIIAPANNQAVHL